MTIFCVTGNSRRSIDIAADILISNGISKGQYAHQGVDISMAQWHEKALASISKTQSIHSAIDIASVGSKKQARDILAAKTLTQDWFWAELQSVRFLEFWKSLDGNIRFLLTSSDITSHLSYHLERGELSSENISNVISEWCELSQQMLSFYLSNSKNTIFLSVNNSFELTEGLESLQEKWDIGISPLTISPTHTPPYTNLISYMVARILDDHPKACDLDNKLKIIFKNSDHKSHPTKKNHLKLALDDLNALSARAEIIKPNKQTEDIKYEEDKSLQISEYPDDRVTLQEQFSDLAEQHGRSREDLDIKLNILISENEILSHQLHQCQEILEKNFAANRFLSIQAREKDLVLASYSTAHPQHCYYESMDIATENSNISNSYQFTINNLYLVDDLIPMVSFRVIESGDGLSACFTKTSNSWLRYTGGRLLDEHLVCNPASGNPYQGENSQLTALSTSSWNKLKALVRLLADITGHPDSANLNLKTSIGPLNKGLQQLFSTLSNWPAVFRYDQVELISSIETGLYQRLEIQIKNLSAGQEFWPNVHYNLATVESTEQTFGQHPRLEFPESTPNALSSWYPEIVDHRGPRCELRFAQPNSIDIGAWNAMSGRDQVLVVALISGFSQQIKDLQASQDSSTFELTKWANLIHSMKSILSNNITKSVLGPVLSTTLSKTTDRN